MGVSVLKKCSITEFSWSNYTNSPQFKISIQKFDVWHLVMPVDSASQRTSRPVRCSVLLFLVPDFCVVFQILLMIFLG